MTVSEQTTTRYCGSRKKRGEGTCTRPAGWGTNHVGSGHCKLHGGSSPGGVLFAARQEVGLNGSFGMATMIDVSPQEALLTCVRLAAGHVAYATHKVAELQQEEEIQRLEETSERTFVTDEGKDLTTVEEKDKGPAVHIWIKVQHECMDRLARYAKSAIDAGIEERKVRLAERWIEVLTDVLDGVFKDLKLTPAQRKAAPTIVQARISRLEAGEVT